MALQYFLGVKAETALYSLLVPTWPSLSVNILLRFSSPYILKYFDFLRLFYL